MSMDMIYYNKYETIAAEKYKQQIVIIIYFIVQMYFSTYNVHVIYTREARCRTHALSACTVYVRKDVTRVVVRRE